MRRQLLELSPSWLASSPHRLGMGISFRCPVHPADCWHHVMFENPIDGGEPATMVPELVFRQREKSLFEELCLYGPLHHGELMLIVYDGQVTVIEN